MDDVISLVEEREREIDHCKIGKKGLAHIVSREWLLLTDYAGEACTH